MSSLDVDPNLSPPEGQTSFSSIPSAHFVEDVDDYMKNEDNAEEKLKVFSDFSLNFFTLSSIFRFFVY